MRWVRYTASQTGPCADIATPLRDVCVLPCAGLAELVNPAAAGLQEKGCAEGWWRALVLGSYSALKAGGGAVKGKGTLPWPDLTPG